MSSPHAMPRISDIKYGDERMLNMYKKLHNKNIILPHVFIIQVVIVSRAELKKIKINKKASALDVYFIYYILFRIFIKYLCILIHEIKVNLPTYIHSYLYYRVLLKRYNT